MVGEERGRQLPAVRRSERGLLVGVRVSPNAKRTRLLGVYGDRLKVQVAAPPERLRANAELRAALAEWLGLPLDYVVVESGNRSRDKVLAFRGVEEAALRERLSRLLTTTGPGKV